MIFLKEKQASVFYFNNTKGGKFECVTKGGRDAFPIDENFWDWWKTEVSYIEGRYVDFCFLYDRDYDILVKKFNMVKNSEWKEDRITAFLKDRMDDSRVRIVSKGNGGEILIEGASAVEDTKEQIFYTNINLDSLPAPRPLQQTGTAFFARYFRELLGIANP